MYQYSKHHRFRKQKEFLGLEGMKRKHNITMSGIFMKRISNHTGTKLC